MDDPEISRIGFRVVVMDWLGRGRGAALAHREIDRRGGREADEGDADTRGLLPGHARIHPSRTMMSG